MAFICPECSTPGSLKITHSIELPPDSAYDEITLQVIACARCNFRGVAVYEESRRGALDSEIVHHQGYRMGEDELQSLRDVIAQCPTPSDARCQCASHRSLGQANATTGRWEGVRGIDWTMPFPMELA